MSERCLPWRPGTTPLMLAPMQGLTNRAFRRLMGEWVKPDVLFTEFVRVRPGAAKLFSEGDRVEALDLVEGIPLVVQLIGTAVDAAVEAAEMLDAMGVRHINLNMGCPFGRMAGVLAGGGMFKDPAPVPAFLQALRRVVRGSLSIKTRAGFHDVRQIFELLPAFENAGIDFLILHARTVEQKYQGTADHRITAELVERTSIPVIANGDIRNVEGARQVLAQTGAAGLMLGRGAISDPLLFERLRGVSPPESSTPERVAVTQHLLGDLLNRYELLFCGETQVLAKLKNTMAYVEQGAPDDDVVGAWLHKMLRIKRVDKFRAALIAGPSS